MRRKKKQRTCSKIIAITIISFGLLDIQLSYILSFFDKQPAESLSVAIVGSVIATALGYFIKSFRENREEANMKYKRDCNNLSEEN